MIKLNAIGTILFFVGVPAGRVYAELEYAGFGVNNYGSTGQCCPGCSDLSYTDDDVIEIDNRLAQLLYDQTIINTNLNVDGRDFIHGQDDDVDPWGTDFADVVVYSGHGTRDCTNYFSAITMGDSTSECSPDTYHGWFASRYMQFGDGGDNEEANLAIFLACQTAHYCVWENHGYSNVDGGADFDMIVGFHGLSYDSLDNTNLYGDYIVSAENNGIGDDWVDLLTDTTPSANLEQCATAIVYGANSAERDDWFDFAGFKDFHDTGSNTSTTYYYIDNCDPNDGEVL